MLHPIRAVTSILAASIGLLATSRADIVYSDNFDSGMSALNWEFRQSSFDSSVDFAFDYSTLGIPSAPNSVGGTTLGMRFLVNQSEGVFQGISATPLNQAFNGDFVLRFDLWMNFVGPFPAGGSGSTQMASFGWGANGTTTQWASSNHSLLFAGSGDGGTAQDYRVYRSAGGAPMLPSTGVYAAGTSDSLPDSRNNTEPYYSSLGGETAPAAQLALYPGQTGTTAAGTMGMAWRDVVVAKTGDTVTWTLDGLLIATVPIEGIGFGGENIVFGMFDINATSSTDANDFLNTAIYDNIRVDVVPEPSTAGLLGLGVLVGAMRRPRRK
jgi:hypothetical protein